MLRLASRAIAFSVAVLFALLACWTSPAEALVPKAWFSSVTTIIGSCWRQKTAPPPPFRAVLLRQTTSSNVSWELLQYNAPPLPPSAVFPVMLARKSTLGDAFSKETPPPSLAWLPINETPATSQVAPSCRAKAPPDVLEEQLANTDELSRRMDCKCRK